MLVSSENPSCVFYGIYDEVDLLLLSAIILSLVSHLARILVSLFDWKVDSQNFGWQLDEYGSISSVEDDSVHPFYIGNPILMFHLPSTLVLLQVGRYFIYVFMVKMILLYRLVLRCRTYLMNVCYYIQTFYILFIFVQALQVMMIRDHHVCVMMIYDYFVCSHI